MKNRHTASAQKSGCVIDRWTNAARGEVQARRQGKPKGKLEVLLQMGNKWSRIPNTLLEAESGQLWLAFAEARKPDKIDPEGGFEAVTVETALEWIQRVSEFCDGYDGDIADVCRIALAELARRPSDLERVKRAVEAERKAGTKFRGVLGTGARKPRKELP